MATDVAASGAEEPERNPQPQQPRAAEKSGAPGFFTIYKKGQGYWTRIGTALAAALIIGWTGYFLYRYLPPNIPWFQNHVNWLVGITAGVTLLFALFAWRMMNKPENVDFLIATDSEMKKVNWTTRRELVGSTKVVIGFMFLIAIVLFLIDQYFTRLFYLFGILSTDAPIFAMFGPLGKGIATLGTSIIIFGGAGWAIWSAARKK